MINLYTPYDTDLQMDIDFRHIKQVDIKEKSSENIMHVHHDETILSISFALGCEPNVTTYLQKGAKKNILLKNT